MTDAGVFVDLIVVLVLVMLDQSQISPPVPQTAAPNNPQFGVVVLFPVVTV